MQNPHGLAPFLSPQQVALRHPGMDLARNCVTDTVILKSIDEQSQARSSKGGDLTLSLAKMLPVLSISDLSEARIPWLDCKVVDRFFSGAARTVGNNVVLQHGRGPLYRSA